MKKSLFFIVVALFVACNLRGQTVLDEPVSLELNRASLAEALYTITDQTGIDITFLNNILPKERINLIVRDEPLHKVLDYLLEGTRVEYQLIGESITLYKNIPEEYTVSGYVEDESTGERLIGASIFDKVHEKAAYTNAYGFFSLTVPEGEIELEISYLGYLKRNIVLDHQKNSKIHIKMRTDIVLDPVEITAMQILKRNALQTAASVDEVNIEQAGLLPSLGGETDLIRSLHLFPGVQTGTDGVGGIFVRGGNPGHNLILIDDVPVYNLSHGAGLLSIFNTDAIRSAQLIKGGAPARYGGRLSSVLDIRTKEGNLHRYSAKAELSLLTANLSVEGPIIPGKASFFFSGRQSVLNWFLKPYSRNYKRYHGERGLTGYNFHDLNLKLNYTIDSLNKVYFSFYKNRDDFLNTGEKSSRFTARNDIGQLIPYRFDQQFNESFDWGNTVSALRWNHVFSPKLFANTTLTYSKLWVNISYNHRDSLLALSPTRLLAKAFTLSRYQSSIEDLGAKIDFELTPSSKYKFLFGVSVNNHLFEPGALQLNESTDELEGNIDFTNQQLESTEYVAYLENHFNIGSRLLLDLGLRATILSVTNRNYRVLQPRLALKYRLSSEVTLNASYGKTYQFLHLLSNSGFGFPTDLWVPSTRTIAPEEAWQTVVGLQWTPSRTWSVKAEAYYKDMDNLITYSEGAFFLSDWQRNITVGRGTSKGVELMLRKNWGRLNGWLSYTLAWTDRQFEKVNQGNPYPFKYDRRHNLGLALVYQLSPAVTFSANYTFSSGLAFSLPLQKYDFHFSNFPGSPTTALVYNGKNQYRLPPYHRLDLGVNVSFKTDWLQHEIKAGVYNAYNRNNPLYYDLRTALVADGEDLREVKEFVQARLLPIMPSLSYAISF